VIECQKTHKKDLRDLEEVAAPPGLCVPNPCCCLAFKTHHNSKLIKASYRNKYYPKPSYSEPVFSSVVLRFQESK